MIWFNMSMITLTMTKIPIVLLGNGRGGGRGGGRGSNFVKKYLIFSFCFGIYGFTRGYRGPESTLKYLSDKNYLYEFGKYMENQNQIDTNKLILSDNYQKEFNKYYKNIIINKINQISIIDKISNGIMEVYPFYFPILNILPIYCLIKRVEIYFLRYKDPYSNKKYYTTSSLTDTCYKTI
jgi:hypothetical protein